MPRGEPDAALVLGVPAQDVMAVDRLGAREGTRDLGELLGARDARARHAQRRAAERQVVSNRLPRAHRSPHLGHLGARRSRLCRSPAPEKRGPVPGLVSVRYLSDPIQRTRYLRGWPA